MSLSLLQSQAAFNTLPVGWWHDAWLRIVVDEDLLQELRFADNALVLVKSWEDPCPAAWWWHFKGHIGF